MVDEESLEAATKNSAREKEEQKGEWDSSGLVARKGSLWLCYAGPLAGRQKNGILGNWQRPKPTP